MEKTRCVIKRNSLGAAVIIILGIFMVLGTVFIYRYDPVNKVWWTGLMTPDKYGSVEGVIISFVLRILCGLSMFAVLFANSGLGAMMIPPASFLVCSVISSAISGSYGYITNSANLVCLAFIAFIYLFERVRLLRKNKWISLVFLLPVLYYAVNILRGASTNPDGYIYLSSMLYFSLMYISFAAAGLCAKTSETTEDAPDEML